LGGGDVQKKFFGATRRFRPPKPDLMPTPLLGGPQASGARKAKCWLAIAKS